MSGSRPANPRRRPKAHRIPQSHVLQNLSSTSMHDMNLNTFLSIAGAALGFAGLVAALFTIRSLRDWRTRCLTLESSLAAVRRELELAASISVKTGRRVQRIEHEYSGVADRVDQVELRGTAQSFEQAIDSARHGADPGKLAQQFGLSRGEADLVTRLHGRKKSA
jgi:hypothetical protein